MATNAGRLRGCDLRVRGDGGRRGVGIRNVPCVGENVGHFADLQRRMRCAVTELHGCDRMRSRNAHDRSGCVDDRCGRSLLCQTSDLLHLVVLRRGCGLRFGLLQLRKLSRGVVSGRPCDADAYALLDLCLTGEIDCAVDLMPMGCDQQRLRPIGLRLALVVWLRVCARGLCVGSGGAGNGHVRRNNFS